MLEVVYKVVSESELCCANRVWSELCYRSHVSKGELCLQDFMNSMKTWHTHSVYQALL